VTLSRSSMTCNTSGAVTSSCRDWNHLGRSRQLIVLPALSAREEDVEAGYE
jgi:hypothetical protein